jgi:hypothetical protein
MIFWTKHATSYPGWGKWGAYQKFFFFFFFFCLQIFVELEVELEVGLTVLVKEVDEFTGVGMLEVRLEDA